MIIYPPIIADTIPAFTNEKIIIPFQENQAVAHQQITGFRLIIKDYQSSKIEATLSVNKDETFFINNEIIFTSDPEKGFATVNPDEYWIPTMSQYYKFQLAYDDGTDYFAYSSASIGRCIGKAPDIRIETPIKDEKPIEDYYYSYQGKCTTLMTEPVYSYRFILTINNTIMQDTGEILNNVNDDTIDNDNNERITNNSFKVKYEISSTDEANLEYSITTINGYKASALVVVNTNTIGDEDLGFKLNISQDDDKAKNNGYVQIKLEKTQDSEISTGWYIIERTELNNKWDELIQFKIENTEFLYEFIWADCSVEQGVKYQYAVRTYDSENNIYGNRHISDAITVDFEDSYLTDNERQLNIKYNPKIASFKSTILEQKMDTIGSKYPFFFRNGIVDYKEFPISGLLSYLTDENEAFMEINSKESNPDNKIYSTQLTGENIAIERKFKLEALNWLNNGKPKLFRSPTEGNYVVRLMNVSLSPNDTLGRMLHTFSATAYEVGENEVEELIKNSIISFKDGGISKPSSILGLFVLGLDVLD